MPTYGFNCTNCLNSVAIQASIKDELPELKCSECGSPMKRVYEVPAGLIFVGNGWGKD